MRLLLQLLCLLLRQLVLLLQAPPWLLSLRLVLLRGLLWLG